MHTGSGPAPDASDRAQNTDEDARVIPFRPRNSTGPGQRSWRWPLRNAQHDASDDLAKYERGEVEDNYRHRMLVNLAGFAFTVVLAVAGAWLAMTMADMRKNQDCYLSGRRNCTPIDVPSLQNR
jgi:hypothetical protein